MPPFFTCITKSFATVPFMHLYLSAAFKSMIEAYRFGKIIIDGKEFTNDVIVFPDKIQSSWWRKEGHRLQLIDLEGVFAKNPKVLIVGTGHDGVMKVDSQVRSFCREKGIELIDLKTAQAVKKYNELAGPGVIGAFHLTC